MFKENKSITKEYATKQDVVNIVEDSADSVMRSCAVQFKSIDERFKAVDERFDRIESTMATKSDIAELYTIMINRFDAVDARFDRIDEKFEESNRRFRAFELYMQGHEKRLTRIEKHLQLV